MNIFRNKSERTMVPEKIGLFEKVSFEQYYADWVKLFGNEAADEEIVFGIYEDIKLPVRSTEKSAGYDFFAPFGFTLEKGSNIVIPTGIRVYLDDDAYLALHPRSGMGFKARLMLANTTGIIDADYWLSDNEGHIMAKICYDGIEPACTINMDRDSNTSGIMFNTQRPKDNIFYKPLVILQGDRFVQGILNTYGITDDDVATGIRNGGEGSTGN